MCPTHVVDTLLLELVEELNHGISLLLDPKIEIGTMKIGHGIKFFRSES